MALPKPLCCALFFNFNTLVYANTTLIMIPIMLAVANPIRATINNSFYLLKKHNSRYIAFTILLILTPLLPLI